MFVTSADNRFDKTHQHITRPHIYAVEIKETRSRKKDVRGHKEYQEHVREY